MIARETSEASWVTSVAGMVCKARVVVAVAEVETGTSGSVVSGRGAVKASFAGDKASEMNSTGVDVVWCCEMAAAVQNAYAWAASEYEQRRTTKILEILLVYKNLVVYTTQDINTRLDNQYTHITQEKKTGTQRGKHCTQYTRCHCNHVAIPLCC